MSIINLDAIGSLVETAPATDTASSGLNGRLQRIAQRLSTLIASGVPISGPVASSNETSTVYNGSTALTPLFATVVASASGVTNVLALVSAKRIRVLALQLTANAAVNVKWQSHASPTDLTGLAYLAANGGYVLPFNPVGWFQTVAGEALDINLSAAVAVGGSITYVTV